MFHPSKFKETYYIYPFIANKVFDGIIVQIQFAPESIAQLPQQPTVEVTLKIANQKDKFETYTINKDFTLFVSKKEVSEYCSDVDQCSLTIEIIKKDKNEIDYTILTNVHSSSNSVEYIYKNKVYNLNLQPKDTRIFYTQIDTNEEG
jgi:hypothetical protein